MTIEITDEMLAAFQAAWDHENRVINDCPGEYVETGARDRAGLAAVVAIIERDHLPRAQLMATLAGQQANITASLAEAAGLLTELAQACAEESLTLKRFEAEL